MRSLPKVFYAFDRFGRRRRRGHIGRTVWYRVGTTASRSPRRLTPWRSEFHDTRA